MDDQAPPKPPRRPCALDILFGVVLLRLGMWGGGAALASLRHILSVEDAAQRRWSWFGFLAAGAFFAVLTLYIITRHLVCRLERRARAEVAERKNRVRGLLLAVDRPAPRGLGRRILLDALFGAELLVVGYLVPAVGSILRGWWADGDAAGQLRLLLALVACAALLAPQIRGLWTRLLAAASDRRLRSEGAEKGSLAGCLMLAVEMLDATREAPRGDGVETLPDLEARLRGIETVERLARVSPEDRPIVCNLLSAYVRRNADWTGANREDAESALDSMGPAGTGKRAIAKLRHILPDPRIDVRAALAALASVQGIRATGSDALVSGRPAPQTANLGERSV